MISVIVPVYNAEHFLNRCIDSILAQTYQNFELILVDDGSTDCSLKVLREYAEKDKRINVISQQNKGVSGARNTGLQIAKGEYFLYVDADDWIEENMLETLLSAGKRENADIIMCKSDHAETKTDVINTQTTEVESWNQNTQKYEFMKHKRLTGMLWNKLIRRSLSNEVWFNEKTGYGEDAEFLWKILKASQKMIVLNTILYHHVLEETSISHLSFSDKKYSAIPMWEKIVNEVLKEDPELINLAKERLMSATVFSMYEARNCKYNNRTQIKHMRKIVRKNLGVFLCSENVSMKFKLYAIAIYLGY